jgi:hypothetical protein
MPTRSFCSLLAVLAVAALGRLATPSARADPPALAPALLPLQFMLGDWTGDGKTETGTSRGTSSIHPVVGGGGILRRDHTDLFDAGGKPAGGFDQLMVIYGDQGRVRADYLDGQHVIHYLSAETGPGESVTFVSDDKSGGPVFRLTYRRTGPETLHIVFSMQPPGAPGPRVIAEGDAHAGIRP